MARKFVFELFGNWFVEFQGVIVEKFFTRLDVSQRINKNAVIFFNRFAVRVAGMVDPARVVATNARVDHKDTATQTEEECVRVVGVGGHTFPRDAFSRVFDDARVLRDAFGRENAAPVDTRLPDLDRQFCAAVFPRSHKGFSKFKGRKDVDRTAEAKTFNPPSREMSYSAASAQLPTSNVAAEGRGRRSVDEWQKSPASAALIRAILVAEFADEKIFFRPDARDDEHAGSRR